MKIAISFGIACSILFSPMPSFARGAAATQPAPLHDKWALLVGVDSFQDPSVPAAKSNANNVANLELALKNPMYGRFGADHVVSLMGPKATKAGIEKIIGGWLEKKALPDDLVLVYLSSASIEGPKHQPMLFGYDTLGSEPESSGIDLQELAVDLKRRIQSKNIVMIIDATPAEKSAPNYAKLAEAGVTVLTAASGNQKSITNGALNRSLFEHRFADSLKQGGGTLTLQQVFDTVAQAVAADAKDAFHSEQHPGLHISTSNPATMNIALGTEVKSSHAPAGVKLGHPIDNLSMSRPDLLLARNPAPVASPTKPETKAAAKDDDDDDDEPKHIDYGPYIAKMKKDIAHNWHPPKGLESRSVAAVFTIMRDGKIVHPTIVTSSGVPAVDQSALEALAATQLDPLPAGSSRSIDMKYKFDWTVH